MTTHWNHTKQPDAPLRWRKPRQARVTLTGAETDAELDRLFAVMALTPESTFEVLAANVDRMKEWADYARKFDNTDEEISDLNLKINGDWSTPVHLSEGGTIPNVAIGTICRTQAEVDHAVPLLLSMPNAGPWLRLEPSEGIRLARLIGPWKGCPHYANFSPYSSPVGTTSGTGEGGCTRPENVFADSGNPSSRPGAMSCRPDGCPFGYIGKLRFIELAGQTGPDVKPLHPQWARQIRDDCAAANVPFRFESWGKWAPYDDDHWPHRFSRDDIQDRDRTKFVGEVEVYPAGPRRSGRTLDGVEHDGRIN